MGAAHSGTGSGCRRGYPTLDRWPGRVIVIDSEHGIARVAASRARPTSRTRGLQVCRLTVSTPIGGANLSRASLVRDVTSR
jgi:hypothetical protein